MPLPKLLQRNKKPKTQALLVRPPRWKSVLLFLLSITLMALAIFARILTSSEEEQLAKLQKEAEQTPTKIAQKENYRKVTTIEIIGNFEHQVKPVSFDDIILEKRSQHFEFKDAEFVVARKDAWTVQIMDVAEEDVILDFLSTAEKREQFAYFRYISDDKSKRYILIFDDFNNKEGAESAIAENDFKLPDSVVPFARSFKDYIGTVDSYHLQRNVRDFKRSNKREVLLRKTSAPVLEYSIPVQPKQQSFKKPKPTIRRQQKTQKQGNAFRENSRRQEKVVRPNLAESQKQNEKLAQKSAIEKKATAEPNKQAVERVPSTSGQSDSLSNLIDSIEQ